jgi:hypothetical protein
MVKYGIEVYGKFERGHHAKNDSLISQIKTPSLKSRSHRVMILIACRRDDVPQECGWRTDSQTELWGLPILRVLNDRNNQP